VESQSITSFTGTLLRREHTLGQKFVQLVFRDNGTNRLCVSTNPRTATLPIGQKYEIKGVFKSNEGREFLLDPEIALFKKHWRPVRRILFVSGIVLCVSTFGGVAYMQEGSTPVKSTSIKQSSNTSPATSNTVKPSVQSAQTPVQTPSVSAPTSTTPTRTTYKRTTTSIATNPTPTPSPTPTSNVPITTDIPPIQAPVQPTTNSPDTSSNPASTDTGGSNPSGTGTDTGSQTQNNPTTTTDPTPPDPSPSTTTN
jgi:hypothetical protein